MSFVQRQLWFNRREMDKVRSDISSIVGYDGLGDEFPDTLAELADVDISGAQEGYALFYIPSQQLWEARAPMAVLSAVSFPSSDDLPGDVFTFIGNGSSYVQFFDSSSNPLEFSFTALSDAKVLVQLVGSCLLSGSGLTPSGGSAGVIWQDVSGNNWKSQQRIKAVPGIDNLTTFVLEWIFAKDGTGADFVSGTTYTLNLFGTATNDVTCGIPYGYGDSGAPDDDGPIIIQAIQIGN